MEATAPRQAMCAIGVMAKAPQPGLAKTRLCPPLRPAEAAELSAAFLRDITENIALAARSVPIHGCVAYAPAGDEGAFAGHLAEGTGLVLADGSPPMPPDVQGFGRCLLHAAQALFAAGFGAVCLVNSDSPTLPTACADPGGTRAAGARRPDRAWPGGRRRLLPVGHEAAPSAPVRRHRLEHERRRGGDAGEGGGAWPRCGHAAHVVRRG